MLCKRVAPVMWTNVCFENSWRLVRGQMFVSRATAPGTLTNVCFENSRRMSREHVFVSKTSGACYVDKCLFRKQPAPVM